MYQLSSCTALQGFTGLKHQHSIPIGPIGPIGYNTHRASDKKDMLHAIGLDSIDALFAAIPKTLRLSRPFNLPEPMTEWQLERHMHALAAKNATTKTHACFLGGGVYEHYIPAVIDALASRGEFLTSYTPYQPEMSQGLLQALFEYQTALSCITGLPVVNGSCYDGATALADAMWVTCLIAGTHEKSTVLISDGVWKHSQKVVKTYADGRDIHLQYVPLDHASGQIDINALDRKLAELKPAGFLFQTPNSNGLFENVTSIAEICARHGVTSVCSFNPLAAGIVTPPGLLGADIVVCDGQPLGLPLSAGGPSLGVFATKKEYRKFVPGRLIGKVTDIRGELAYALVYQDREQHVARERATSNLCSNQALNALRAVMYLALLGEEGLKRIAVLNTQKAHYLAEKLMGIPGVKLAHGKNFFNEFVIALPKPVVDVKCALQAQHIFAGIEYPDNQLLICATETKNRADLDHYANTLRKVLA